MTDKTKSLKDEIQSMRDESDYISTKDLITLINRKVSEALEGKWISVEDESPKDIGLWYVVTDGKKVDHDIFDGEEFIKFNTEVTHYQPRPKPPKEKNP